METAEKPFKLTVRLADRALYQAIRQLAAERGQTVRQVVAEALREWLERQEDKEDLAAIAETESEETYPWEQVKRELQEV